MGDIDPIIRDIHERAGEWIEQAGEESPALVNNILAGMLRQEKEKQAYYKNYIRSLESEIKKLKEWRNKNVSFNTKHN